MSLFQNYRLFLGLYSKNIATYWEFEDCRWNERLIPYDAKETSL